METLLTSLRACAEPTRLRLLALAARGTFCVMELTEILGQSQPRLSRHLRLLCEAGLLERAREGANVWFTLAGSAQAALVRDILGRLEEDDPVLSGDRRHAARVVAERARAASEKFRRQGAEWDEMQALDLPADAVAQALLALLPAGNLGRLLDIGTGTGAPAGTARLAGERRHRHRCQPRDAGAGPHPPGPAGALPLHRAAGRHVSPALP